MAAILRVKRRCNDERKDALVIACKRSKTTENEIENAADVTPVTAYVKFAGTITNQEEDVVEHLVKTLGKEELQANYKQHVVDIKRKTRENIKQQSMEGRYKVINCRRSLDTSNLEQLDDKVTTVIDIEDSISCSASKDAEPAKPEEFVYDLYYTETGDDVIIDDFISIHVLDQEFVFDTYRDRNECEDEFTSEDSNSESNWRNDYPDTESSDSSIDEEDIKRAVRRHFMDDEDSDSSEDDSFYMTDDTNIRKGVMRIVIDDEESSEDEYNLANNKVTNNLMHTVTDDLDYDVSSEDDFVYAVDEQDVERYGIKYAKFKASIFQELNKPEDNLNEYSGVSITEIVDDEEEKTTSPSQVTENVK